MENNIKLGEKYLSNDDKSPDIFNNKRQDFLNILGHLLTKQHKIVKALCSQWSKKYEKESLCLKVPFIKELFPAWEIKMQSTNVNWKLFFPHWHSILIHLT